MEARAFRRTAQTGPVKKNNLRRKAYGAEHFGVAGGPQRCSTVCRTFWLRTGEGVAGRHSRGLVSGHGRSVRRARRAWTHEPLSEKRRGGSLGNAGGGCVEGAVPRSARQLLIAPMRGVPGWRAFGLLSEVLEGS